MTGPLRSGLGWALSSARLTPRPEQHQIAGRSYVAYYRVSTSQQARSGLGLDGQRSAVQKFAARWRGQILAEFTEVESGQKRDRPRLREALGACRARGATLLIAQLDRLARNVALVAMIIETGTDFIAADFPEANGFTKHILAAIAENELKIMSDRRKAACAVLKARGVNVAQHLAGTRVRRPSDLDAARAARLRRDTARAIALAPLLRELRDSGASINRIAAELTRLDIETPQGGVRWHASPLRRLFFLSGEELPARRGGQQMRQRHPTIGEKL